MTAEPRRSTRIQERQTSKLGDRVLEVAGQLHKNHSAISKIQGQLVEALTFVNLLNNRRQPRQQMKFVKRPGAIQEKTSNKRNRKHMNEIQVAQRNSTVTIAEDDRFGTSSSMGHCVSLGFFMGAGIARSSTAVTHQ